MTRRDKRGTACSQVTMLLKLYLFGYINRVHSSRRLENACRVNLELLGGETLGIDGSFFNTRKIGDVPGFF